MKPIRNRFLASPLSHGRLPYIASFVISLCASGFAYAANQTWDGDSGVDAGWATVTNWAGGAAPGSTTTTTNDLATFNSALFGGTVGGAANPVVVDLNRRIGRILFDTANVGPYVIGATGGNNLILSAVSGFTNTVSIGADVTASQTLAGPIRMTQPNGQSDNYGFTNNSTTAGANMVISGNIDATNTTRTWQFILDGSNTGNNIISGNINNTTTSGNGGAGPIQKNGTGTWILSGTNIFIGSTSSGNNLHPIVTNGVQVNAGTLVLENNLAFGNTAGAKVFVNGGVLELNSSGPNGSITLENALTLNVANGATLRSAGTNATNSKISFATGAGVSATLSTVNSGDIFTVGNAANDFSGGASDSLVHIAGPGTVLLGFASNYAGSVSVDAGTLKLGNATALGPAASAGVSFGAGSTGKLLLDGLSPTIASLNTNATVGSPVVENNNASPATLTVSHASVSSTFAGVLQDGAAGTLALTKAGASTLTLSGVNTYSGVTTINGGTLLAANTSGSATGTGAVAVNSGATLGGTGSISGAVAVNTGGTLTGTGSFTGAVTVAANAAIAPGNGGIGTLHTGPLTLISDAQLDFDLTNASTLDVIAVTGTLTINGGQLNINGGLATYTTNGVYNLMTCTGLPAGTGASALVVNPVNKDITKSYVFGQSAGLVTLTIANSGAVVDYWNVNADGNWSAAGSWTPGIPNATGAFAAFGGGGTAITAPRTVTVDGAFTVGTLAFNNATQAFTLAAGGGANITLNNGGGAAFLTDTAGSHLIQAPLTLTANGASVSVVNLADTLAVSNVVSGSGALTKIGNGTLALSGTNTYTGNTQINAGTVTVNNATSLGDPSYLTTIGEATLQATDNITSTRNFNITDVASTISVDAAKTYTISGVIGAGAGTLNKTGGGTLALTGINTYTGGTVINAGTVQVNNAASLGDAAGALTLNSATLQVTAGFTGARNVTLAGANSIISVDPSQNYTIGGLVSGSGVLQKTGTGTLTLSSANSYSGGTQLDAGTLALGNSTAAGSGTITAATGTTIYATSGVGSGAVSEPITLSGLNANVTLTNNNASGGISSLVTGSVDQMVSISSAGGTGVNMNGTGKQFQGFPGTVSVPSGQYLTFRATSLNNGGDNTLFDINGGLSTRNNGNVALGALSGSGTVSMGGSGGNGFQLTYTIGARGTDATFSGVIQEADTVNGKIVNVIKTGGGTQTLSGACTYTGTTTVNNGILDITGSLVNSVLRVTAGEAVIEGTGSVTTTNPSGPGPYANNDGTMTVKGSGTYAGAGDFNIGDTGNTTVAAVGTLNIQDSATVSVGAAGGLYVGSGWFTNTKATGTVNQSGGTISTANTAAGAFVLGGRLGNGGTETSAFTTGTYNLSGGTATANGTAWIGGYGSGTLTLSSTGVFNANAGLLLANGVDADGTVNLDGGTLNATQVAGGAGTSTFNFNGGTLKAGASATFLTGVTNVNVSSGGALIDTNGNDIVIANALVDAGGGLTKSGAGKLTLSGVSAYTGATSVSAGTLEVTGTLGTTAVTVSNLATLGGNGNIGGPVTIASGGHHALAVAATPGTQVTRAITGTLTLTAGNILDLTAAVAPAAGTYVLATATSITAPPTTVTYTGITGGSVTVVGGNQLVLTVGAAGYSSWASNPANGLTAGVNDGETQDPDNDGIKNLLEYVFGGIPNGAGAANTSVLPTQSLNATNLVLTFRRSDLSEADTAVKVQWSNNMSTWTDFATIGAVSALPDVAVTEDVPSAALDTVVVTIPRAGKEASGKLFARVIAVK